MFGALAAVGTGLHVAAYAAEGETEIGTVGVVLLVAIAVFLFCIVYFALYSILFRGVDLLHQQLAAGMVLILVVAVVMASVGLPLGWCLIVVMVSLFVVAVGYETSGFRDVEEDVRREG